MVVKPCIVLSCLLAILVSAASFAESVPGAAYSKIVSRRITIDVRNQPLKRVLQLIEQKAYFKFSYNADIIDEEKQVSLHLNNQPVSDALQQLFNETIRYKEAGNHLILLKNDPAPEQRENAREDYYFQGRITDEETGQPVQGASIYDVEARQASISDAAGNYHLTLPVEASMHAFYFSKTGYYDTLLVVRADVSLVNDITLRPENNELQKLPGTQISPIDQHIEESAIGKLIIPEEDYVHSENLSAIEETRAAQISFLPSLGIGSNLSTNGLIINHFSLNVLAGYSNGVKGCEIGGIMNATKNNVIGAQVGGIGNLVGGTINGVQVGGISNVVFDQVRGVQVGGISNLVHGDMHGVQIGGISNMISGGFNGLQVAGINNFARHNSRGFQIAGINNVVTDTLYGGQIAGIGNWARRGINRCQISGIVNIAQRNEGLQLTGIYNHCQTNNGIQIGLFNSSISGDGMAIGLLSYSKNGYRCTEISANEVFLINLSFKTGVDRFYNFYSAGITPGVKPSVGAGLGFGLKANAGKRVSFSFDASSHVVQLVNFDYFQGSSLNKIAISVDLRLGKWLTFYSGASFNVGVSRYLNVEGEFENFTWYEPFYAASYSNAQAQLWIGAQAGLRFGINRSHP